MLGRDDIKSITINYPYGTNMIPPGTQVSQMLKLTRQDLCLDLEETTLSEDEKIISRVARGVSNITAKEALTLAKHFNTGVDYWIDRQKAYDNYLLESEKYKMSTFR